MGNDYNRLQEQPIDNHLWIATSKHLVLVIQNNLGLKKEKSYV